MPAAGSWAVHNRGLDPIVSKRWSQEKHPSCLGRGVSIQIYTMQSVAEAKAVACLGVDHVGVTPSNRGLPGEVERGVSPSWDNLHAAKHGSGFLNGDG